MFRCFPGVQLIHPASTFLTIFSPRKNQEDSSFLKNVPLSFFELGFSNIHLETSETECDGKENERSDFEELSVTRLALILNELLFVDFESSSGVLAPGISADNDDFEYHRFKSELFTAALRERALFTGAGARVLGSSSVGKWTGEQN